MNPGHSTRLTLIASLALLALALSATRSSGSTPNRPWHEALLREASSDYRRALESREQLYAELAALPEAPRNQQSGQLGYQIHRPRKSSSRGPMWIEVRLPAETPIDAIVLVPIDAPIREFPGPGYGFPQRFRVEVFNEVEERIVTDYSAQPFLNPGGLPVWIPAHGVNGQRVRITMTEAWTGLEPYYVFALGEVMAISGNRNVAAGAPVSTSEPTESLYVWGKPAYLTDSQSLLGASVANEPSPALGYHSQIENVAGAAKWVQIDLGSSIPIDEVRLIGGYVAQFPSRPGFGFPVRFKIEAGDEPTLSKPVLLVDETFADFPNPATNPVTFPVRHLTARYVRVTATKLWERVENFAFALAELQIYSGNRNVALGRPVECLDQYPSGEMWLPRHLTDGFASDRRLTEWPDWLRGLSRRREVLAGLAQADRKIARIRETADDHLTDALWLTTVAALAGVFAIILRVRRTRQRAVEHLRQRIASDLHDEVGSNLGSIALLSEMGTRRADDTVRTDLEEIHRVARQTADSMRDIVGLIQRPALTGKEFLGKLREVAGRMLAGLDSTFEVHTTLELPSLTAQRHLLLTFKEALHNIRKHAQARKVSIDVSRQGQWLQLRVTDDGIGFDPDRIPDGHGIANLRHRAKALGGNLTIESRPGAGTTLTLQIDQRQLALFHY